MKNSVKTLVFITIISLFSLSSTAQLKLPFTGIGPDVRKVIEDYPNHFNNLLGELIAQNPQSTDYECNFKMEGAVDVSITQYSSAKNNVCSWQALMLNTESFEKAKQKFKALFNQLNNLNTKAGHLKGNYITPTEEKRFAAVLFSFNPSDETIKKLKVELSLQYEEMEWKVRVLVYDRDREDDEKGKTVEN
jgi:hypothetical protein